MNLRFNNAVERPSFGWAESQLTVEARYSPARRRRAASDATRTNCELNSHSVFQTDPTTGAPPSVIIWISPTPAAKIALNPQQSLVLVEMRLPTLTFELGILMLFLRDANAEIGDELPVRRRFERLGKRLGVDDRDPADP